MRFPTAVLALTLLAGCGGDKPGGPKTLPGTYPLVSFDGRNLPAVVFQSGTFKAEVTAGTITMNANGTFSDSYSFRETDDGTVTNTTIPCSGTWAQSGNTIALEETASGSGDCGSVGSGSWDGNNTLTIEWNGAGGAVVHRR